jgi:hypothetical protein
MKARPITRFRDVAEDGSILGLVVWRVHEPVPPTGHGYKYRAAYVVDGRCVIGFDNERGKGDHRHLGTKQFPYTFTTVEQLVEDFIKTVDAYRSRK